MNFRHRIKIEKAKHLLKFDVEPTNMMIAARLWPDYDRKTQATLLSRAYTKGMTLSAPQIEAMLKLFPLSTVSDWLKIRRK